MQDHHFVYSAPSWEFLIFLVLQIG